MRWSERQRAMLREMGIRVWSGREDDAAARSDAVLVADPPVPVPARIVAPPPVAGTIGEPPAGPAGPTSAGASSRASDRSSPVASAAPPELVAAEWLFVGEPFDAGGDAAAAADHERLLDNMLAAIHVSRAARTPVGRAAHLAWREGDAPAIEAAIARVAPRVIVALGRAAAGALLGVDEPLGRLRERMHARGGVPVVVTFSLAYLLRHSADKAKAWADLCRAVAAIE